MKQKYYLRGLGIGILVTALVFTVTGPSEMTDEEIIKRAEALGYVKAEEEDAAPTISLKELMESETPAPTKIPEVNETPIPTITSTPVPTMTPTPVPTITSTPVPTETPIPTMTPTPAPTEEPEEPLITAQISVERGDSAIVVCRKMEEAGIITDAVALRDYIVANGLADYINIGTYTLTNRMSYEEIAKIITLR